MYVMYDPLGFIKKTVAVGSVKSGTLLSRTISVLDAKQCFHELIHPPLTLHQNEAYQRITQFSPQQGTDKLIWNISSSSVFTVRSVYRILSRGGKTKSSLTSAWKAKVTPSMKLFFYMLLNNRLLTHEIMQKRNLTYLQGCVMCAPTTPETTMHLFFGCPFAMNVWSQLSTAAGYDLLQVNESPSTTFLSSAPTDKTRLKTWMAIFVSATSNIWKERNNRTFRHTSTTHSVLAQRIHHEAITCLKHC